MFYKVPFHRAIDKPRGRYSDLDLFGDVPLVAQDPCPYRGNFSKNRDLYLWIFLKKGIHFL